MPKRIRLVKQYYYRWQQLSWPERKLLLQALFFLPLMPVGLSFLSFMDWKAFLLRFTPLVDTRTQSAKNTGTDGAAHQQAVTSTQMVAVACRLYANSPTCLHHSLTLWHLLRCQGIDSTLQIGARKEAGQFAAHAWVEYGDIVLNDVADIRQLFVPFITEGIEF